MNNRLSSMTVRVYVQTLYDYLEILYPADKYVVVEIPPRGSYTLDVSVRDVGEGEEHISINVEGIEYYSLFIQRAVMEEELLKVMVFSRVSLRNITLNLYANFKVFQFEIYRRPVVVRVSVCNTESFRVQDGVCDVKIPVTYEVCDVKVFHRYGSYELGTLRVEDTMSLTIPDFNFSLTFIVCSFILLLLLHFILPSFQFSIRVLITIIVSTYSWFFEPYLSVYPVMFEIMVLSGYFIHKIPRRLRRILSGPRKYKPRK